MEDSKISQLLDGDSEATTANYLPAVITGITKRVSISKILSLLTDSDITSKLLTGFSSAIGTVTDTDTILQAFNKLSANVLQTSCKQAPDVTVSTGTHTCDFNAGSVQKITKTGDFTLAFSNVPAGVYSTYVIHAINWGVGTVTLPTHLKAGDTALSFTASGRDEVVCRFDKDGTLAISVAKDWKA